MKSFAAIALLALAVASSTTTAREVSDLDLSESISDYSSYDDPSTMMDSDSSADASTFGTDSIGEFSSSDEDGPGLLFLEDVAVETGLRGSSQNNWGCQMRTWRQCNGDCTWNRGRCEAKQPTNQQVSCGGHVAQTCGQCPQGHGQSWCNGDCSWNRSRGMCEAKQTNRQVSCGGHFAQTCGQCPQGHGQSWCNGDCSWNRSRGMCEAKGGTSPDARVRDFTYIGEGQCKNGKGNAYSYRTIPLRRWIPVGSCAQQCTQQRPQGNQVLAGIQYWTDQTNSVAICSCLYDSPKKNGRGYKNGRISKSSPESTSGELCYGYNHHNAKEATMEVM